jgi:hypothetical protein
VKKITILKLINNPKCIWFKNVIISFVQVNVGKISELFGKSSGVFIL